MSKIATIRYSRASGTPVLEVTVPSGTLPNQTARFNDYLTNDLIPKLTGHQGCYSGLDFRLREEEVERVVRVDLERGAPV